MFSSHTSFVLITITAIAILGFGGVHFSIYVVLSILLAFLLPYCAYEFSYRPPNSILIASLCFLLLPLVLFVPVDTSVHQTYFSSVANHLSLSFSLTNTSKYPLLIQPYGAIKGLIYTQIYLLGFLIGCIYFQKTYHVRKFSYSLCHLGGIFCIIGYAQRFFEAPTIYWISGVPSFMREMFFGTYGNPSHAGYFLVFLTPLALSLKRNYAISYGILFGVTILYTGSRGALLAWAIGISIYFLLRFQITAIKYIISGMLFLTVLFLLYINYEYSADFDDFSSERFTIWKTGFDILSHTSWPALLFGHGGNSFVDLYTVFKTTNTFSRTYHFHQEFFEWIVEYGLLHFFIVVFFIVQGLRNIFVQYQIHSPQKAKYKLSLLSSCCAMFVGFSLDITLHIPSIGFLFFLVLGTGFAKQGTSQITSVYYVIPYSILSILTIIAYTTVEHENSIFASHTQIQKQAELEYKKKHYTTSQDLLLLSIQTAPLRARPLRIYNQIPTENFGTYTQSVIDRAPNDVYSYISAARIAMRQDKKIESWKYWNQALSLQVPNNNHSESLVKEALQVDPHIALFYAIPIQNERLRNAINYMIEEGRIKESILFMENFYDLAPEFQYLYAKLLYIDNQCQKAWKYHQPAINCPTSQLESKIASCLQSNSSKYHRKTVGLCGRDPDFELEYLKAQLREGLASSTSQAVQFLKEHPQNYEIRRLLIHCLLRNNDPQYAQIHLRYLIQENVATEAEKKDLILLRNRKPTQHYPLSFIQLEDPS